MGNVKTLSVTEMILSLDGGGSVEEIQEQVRKVSTAVKMNGGTGSVTIKLTFKRNGKEGSRSIGITDTISSTLPKIDKGQTLFFTTDDGDLTRQNPDQLNFAMGDKS